MMEESVYSKQEENNLTNPYEFPDYFFAGFWIRFFAFLVDLLCIWSISNVVLNTFSIVHPISDGSGIVSVSGFTKLIVYLGYFILLTKLNRGQTIGKMIFGLQVISMDDIQLSWTTVLVREGACRFILKMPLFAIGYVVAAFTKRKQHVGDYFSQTSVISLNIVKSYQMAKK